MVLLTRDLRVHDSPALASACARHASVLPLFVLDHRVEAGARARLLAEALAALRAELRRRGGDLVVRRGDPVQEAVRLARRHGATTIVSARDVTTFARRRERALAGACAGERLALQLVDAVGVVPPGALTPAGGDHYRVFTPYWRAWSAASWRPTLAAPDALCLPEGTEPGELPVAAPGSVGVSAAVGGGEMAARQRMRRFLADGLAGYVSAQMDLAADATSHLSPALHLGCVSALELASAARSAADAASSALGPGGRAVDAAAVAEGAEAFVRQLCWRDFFAQVLAARPAAAREDYRPRRQPWRDDPVALEAWQQGRTGVPIVDAGMRQLAVEGFLPNRVRLVVASYLTRQLGVHWSEGAAHFARLLVDADVSANAMNWQWAAGTGNDPRPNRVLNPDRQARRLDPTGAYVGRHLTRTAM